MPRPERQRASYPKAPRPTISRERTLGSVARRRSLGSGRRGGGPTAGRRGGGPTAGRVRAGAEGGGKDQHQYQDRSTDHANLLLRSCQTIRRLRGGGFEDDAPVDDYELIDAGEGARLERFGHHIVHRKLPAASGEWRSPGRWADADLRFDRDRGWSGTGLEAARSGWNARVADLTFELRPTDAGQVGIFPEHAATLPWLRERVDAVPERPTVLNLFGYTGMATLALARAGAAVVHVDAARPTVAWARRNAALDDLADRPIRWLVDDAGAFVAREIRRGRRYDGVVLDPPTYGHGASGKAWRLETDLQPLLDDVRSLLTPTGWVLLTAHSEAIDADDLGAWLSRILGDVEIGELRLDATSGASLELGAFARGSGAS